MRRLACIKVAQITHIAALSGKQDQKNQLDEKMMQNVRAARKDADILLAIVDVSDRPEEAMESCSCAEHALLISLPCSITLAALSRSR